ncbi:TPA: riboflavin synthase [Candidatus Uhrbacteria bacterium]|nr:riboflavin synthase [Candidatus Uhrbacteria bacterium]
MFTGIIRGLGEVVAVNDRENFREIVVDAKGLIAKPVIGASVAVSGVCLTITKIEDSKLFFEAMEETLKKTTTGDLIVGSQVNIETPMMVGDELGGHFVLCHVDGVGEVVERITEGENTHLTFSVPANLVKYIVDKGSVAVDGISLTICDPADDKFSVWLLPLTLKLTTLGEKNVGDKVNLEADYLLKAVLGRA